MNKKILLLGFLFLAACSTFELRPDPAPSPIDLTISETRLEFQGCGVDSGIGTLVCLPGGKASIVTEFAGDVIYFSSGQSCSVRVETRATPPLTQLTLPAVKSICPLVVYYLPDYPQSSTSIYPIKGIFGEISLQPDTQWTPGKSFSLTTSEILTLKFPGAVRGAFISRQLTSPEEFTGDTLTFQAKSVGTDLIQVKLWMADGTNQFQVIAGNYFSPFSLQLRFDHVQTADALQLTFPASVSVITVNHQIFTDLSIKLPRDFTGDIRAYTVQGRTIVARFQAGELQWLQ